jgi:toxin YoeB
LVAKKDKSQDQPLVQRSPGFSTQFKTDLAAWFKTDYKKASKILVMVTAVMAADPFKGIGKPEPLKYLDADIWSRRIRPLA